MTNAKELFLRPSADSKPTIAQWWASVVRDERYTLVATFARAETMELRPTQAQMEGAEMMLNTLKTLCDAEDTSAIIPESGLHHNFDVPKTTEKKD